MPDESASPALRRWLPAPLIAAAFALTAASWRRLPDEMAIHWDLHGQPNGWGGRATGTLLLPAMALALWGILTVLPRLDPHRANYRKFQSSYDLVIATTVATLVMLHVAIIGVALGWPVSITRVAPLAVGLLFVVLGNVLPRARPNWWFGIRTPWTLTDDRVWVRTHRVGGRMLVAAGLVALLAALVPGEWSILVMLAAVAVAGVGSVAYSYVAWRQERSR